MVTPQEMPTMSSDWAYSLYGDASAAVQDSPEPGLVRGAEGKVQLLQLSGSGAWVSSTSLLTLFFNTVEIRYR